MDQPPTTTTLYAIKSMCRNLIFVLISFIIAANSIVLLSSGEVGAFLGDMTVNITAATALGAALITVHRQKLDGLYGITFAALTIGLALWFVAELVWTYFEFGLRIETPYPSIADLLWLTGYVFFAYHIYRIYNYVRIESTQPSAVVMVSVVTAIILAYLVILTINVSEYTQTQGPDDLVLLIISIAYPILDGMLIVPAILVLWAVRDGQLANTHWILLALFMLVSVAADSSFGYVAVFDINLVHIYSWLWNILYATAYLLIAAALFWHIKFFIFNEKEITKKWQEQNR